MTELHWEFINSFAPWLSAIGTLAAVVVSLYLALQRDRIKLGVRVEIYQVIGEGRREEDIVSATVTNKGRRPATIMHLYWTSGRRKRGGLWWGRPDDFPPSDSVPKVLLDGESASFSWRTHRWRHDGSRG